MRKLMRHDAEGETAMKIRIALMLLVGVLAAAMSACPAWKDPTKNTVGENCRNPNYVPAMKEQAQEYYNKNLPIEALKVLKDAEQCHPRDPEVYYLFGRIYYDRQRYYDAIDYFQKAIAVDRTHTQSRVALGVVYVALNRWDEAIAQFEKATQDDVYGQPWEVFNNLAWAYLQKGDLERAELSAKKALALNDQWCPAYCNLGEVYAKKGLKEQAVINYQKAIKVCKDTYARPHYLLGLEFGEMGHVEMACQELGAAAAVKNAPEAEQARDYLSLYNCPGVVHRPTAK
jgi:tetratricopeptide (TPR) repeat protein